MAPIGRALRNSRYVQKSNGSAAGMSSRPAAAPLSIEDEYAIIYRSVKDAIFNIAVEGAGAYRFHSVNKAFCEATGLAQDNVVGKLVGEVIPPPSLPLVLGKYQQAIDSGATVKWEERTRFPTGDKVGSVSVTPVFSDSGVCTSLVGTVHDITELKQTEEQLRTRNASLLRAIAEREKLGAALLASEERLQHALDSSDEGVWDWSVATHEVFYSPRWKQIAGLEESAADDYYTWARLVHPDDLAGALQAIQNCLEGAHGTYVHEYRLAHPRKEWIWIRAHGKVTHRTADGKALRMVGTIADITEQKRLQLQLDQSRAMMANLAEQAPGALFQLLRGADASFSCPFISAASQQMFELDPEQMKADCHIVCERICDDDREQVLRALHTSALTLQPWRMEFRVRLPQRGLCWREANANPQPLAGDKVLWHGFVSDITERKATEETICRINEQLDRRAHYDALTGLPNRTLFRDRLDKAIGQARRDNAVFALLFLDLDGFKAVNDLLGHGAGDALLRQAGERIRQCLLPDDTVARLGGDEFTVILSAASELPQVEAIAKKILEALAQPYQIGIECAQISASIGATWFPRDGQHPEDLMRNADQAMYRAKNMGRNQLRMFERSMHLADLARLKMTGDLRGALSGGQLELYFQPIIDIDSGRILKSEALLRWHRPGFGLTSPVEFIPLAEDTGLIHDIGNWVFIQAAYWSQRWSGMLGRPFQISINKSPVQFQPRLHSLDWVDYLDRLGIPRHSVGVEITEGVLLHPTEAVFEKLSALQAGGIEVSIDDFGTGYSSMNYLKRLPIDYLKIDGSFVAEMLNDVATSTITETIVVMAHKLGLKVIAEGVETPEQLAWLRSHHCDFAQGFLISQPVTAAAFQKLLLAAA